MVRIRLARGGTKKKAHYRVVIIDSRAKRNGKYIDTVGTYNPHINENAITLDEEKVLYWYRKGAQPSETVKSLIKKQGIKLTTK
ncbi:MAG: 30S ribosomal protein S16 [Spirochaetota bacterium]|nr:30S ribosomal protein S16 [Spirochaetota bacterium]